MATTTDEEKDRFIQAKAKGKSNRAAAMIAKPNIKADSAAVVGHRLANDPVIKPLIQKTAQEALNDSGLNMDDWMAVLIEARNATKLIVHGKNSEDGWTEEVPDWGARLKATDMAVKISGGYITVKPQAEEKTNKQLSQELVDDIKQGKVEAFERIVFKSEPQQGTNEPIK